MSQMWPLSSFKWVKNTSHFSKDFMEDYNEDTDEGYFPQVHVQYPENFHSRHNDLSFLHDRMKIEKAEKFGANLLDEKICDTRKKPKTSIKSQISIEKSAWSH